MLKLSKKVDYGLILLSNLNAQADAASAREMADRYHLPQSMVANILKSLAGAGILRSTRGAQGGYELARAAEEVTLADIVRALEGPFNLVDCVAEDPGCKFTEVCPTHDPIQTVHRRFELFMRSLTLAELTGKPPRPISLGMRSNEDAYLHG